MKTIENALIKDYTTYKLSGKIDKVVYPETTLELITILKELKNKKHKIIGNGSNLIFVGDYNGTIIKLDNFNTIKQDGTTIKVGAGVSVIGLAIISANNALTGLEFASGIPATIGGAIYMNAGAYKSQMSDVVKEITVLTENYEIKTLTNEELEFGYRTSILKHKNWVCLDATLELKEGNKEEILTIINDRKKRRLSSQPLEYPSAGSVFRNPENNYAGKLIEDLGFKGIRVGDAAISNKHANFIINLDNASGKDVKELIELIKIKVKEKYNIELIVEQEIVE